MPSESPKQKRFFQAVKHAKHDPRYGDAHIRKVANSMTDSDIDDFANHLAELRVKKAMLSILKDVRDPMYLNEEGEDEVSVNPISKTWKAPKDAKGKNPDFSLILKKYVGQPFSPKEFDALETFKKEGGTPPTKIERTEIWFEAMDSFNKISTTTVIRKMKEGMQFSYNSFTKKTNVEPKEPEAEEPEGMGEIPPPSPEAGGLPPMGGVPPPGGAPPMMEIDLPAPGGTIPPAKPTLPNENPEDPENPNPDEEEEEEKNEEEIVLTKSILFKDDIKGAAILVKFLKALDI